MHHVTVTGIFACPKHSRVKVFVSLHFKNREQIDTLHYIAFSIFVRLVLFF
jgi:hypothetical protein